MSFATERIFGLSNRGATICISTGRPSGGLTGGYAAGRKTDEGDQKRRRDPFNIVLEFAAIDLGGKIHRHWVGPHRRCRREQDVKSLEQLAKAMKHPKALVCSALAISSAVTFSPALTLPLRLIAELLELRQTSELLAHHPGAAPSLGLHRGRRKHRTKTRSTVAPASCAGPERRAGRLRRSRHRRRWRRYRTRMRRVAPWHRSPAPRSKRALEPGRRD